MKPGYLVILGGMLGHHVGSCGVVAVHKGTGVRNAVQLLGAHTR
jgi:hypothetical protein